MVNNIESSNIVILGNKIVLDNKGEVSTEEGKNFAQKKNYDFFEVSAKEDNNLNNTLFNSMLVYAFL